MERRGRRNLPAEVSGAPNLQRHPPPTPLVFECGSDGVAEHLLVWGHLASAWAKAPELAWASTGADWPCPPSVPPAVFTTNTSKVICRALTRRGWRKEVGAAQECFCYEGVGCPSSAAPGLTAVGPAVLFTGAAGRAGREVRWAGQGRHGGRERAVNQI